MTQPRSPLGGRYSLERPLLSSRAEHHWIAIEVSSGRLVVVAICESVRLGTLALARGLTHRHLATLIDVVKDLPAGAFTDRVEVPAGAGVVVAEHVPGITLRKTLEDGPIHAAKAVAWILRLADAVQALHAVGSVHGAISPRSVLASAEGRPIAPVLSQLMVPPVGAFCPPERLRGAPEAPSDDVWALHATLYTALTGKAPFSGSTRDALLRSMSSRPSALSTFGVNEPALQEMLARGLLADRRGRLTDLSELVALLDGWERDPRMMPPPVPPPRPMASGLGDIASGAAFGALRDDDDIIVDDANLPDDQGRSADSPDDDDATVIARPHVVRAYDASSGASVLSVTLAEPVPRPQVTAAPKRPSINPFARKGNPWPWLLGALVLGGALAYFAFGGSGKPEPKQAAATSELPSVRKAAAKPAEKKDPDAQRDACVVAHFASDSFEGRPDFSFVCQDADFRETAGRLHAMVRAPELPDAGADAAGIPLDVVRAVREVDGGAPATRLGWYELPTAAIIRKACCPQAAPVELPETEGSCEQLQAIVRRLADDSAKSVDLALGARSFDKAVGCLYAQRIRHGYGYERLPTPANRALFQRFLGHAAIISAKR